MNNLSTRLLNLSVDAAIELKAKDTSEPAGVIDHRLVELLLTIDETKSIQAACERLAYSPRNAQRMLKRLTEGSGLKPLKHHGPYGTGLSEDGRACIALYRDIRGFAEHEIRRRESAAAHPPPREKEADMSLNHITLSGNLTRDAELRRTQNDTAVLNFGLAFNERRRKDGTDEWEEVANFVDCVLFGNRAEALESHLVKGTKVSIDGRLRWNQWESEDGIKRSKHEIVVADLEFLSPRKDEE